MGALKDDIFCLIEKAFKANDTKGSDNLLCKEEADKFFENIAKEQGELADAFMQMTAVMVFRDQIKPMIEAIMVKGSAEELKTLEAEKNGVESSMRRDSGQYQDAKEGIGSCVSCGAGRAAQGSIQDRRCEWRWNAE